MNDVGVTQTRGNATNYQGSVDTMQVAVMKTYEEPLQEARLSDARGLVLRLTQIEAELAGSVFQSSDTESEDNGLTKFYTSVVARLHAVETAIYEREGK